MARFTGRRPAVKLSTPAISVASLLAVGCGLGIILLSALRVLDAPAELRVAGGLAVIAAFGALTVMQFRYAVAVVLVELVAGGAAGGWITLPGGVSGRMVMLAILTLAAAIHLWRAWRVGGRAVLGRYAIHATVLAVGLPIVWLGLAVASGTPLEAAVQDGNGYTALAFVLVVVSLLVRGEGAWFRDWLFLATVFNAVFTFGLVILALTRIVPLFPEMRAIFLDGPTGLGFGGALGYLPTGAGRLWLASGLYLQVGLVLTVARLMKGPARWEWAVFAILLVDVAASYTRGFWIASIVGVALVLAFGYVNPRRLAQLGATVAITALAATLVGWTIGGSVPDYLLQRAASTTVVGSPPPGSGEGGPTPTTAPGGQPDAPPTVDQLGADSNAIRVVQARVLLAEIRSSPFVGHGFGAIARDYPYGDGFVYELTYLDIAFKTGLLGLILFLSFPVRLLIDSLRARFRGLPVATGLERRDAAVPLAMLASVLFASATNPYLLAAYGILPIAAAVAWLDPSRRIPRDG